MGGFDFGLQKETKVDTLSLFQGVVMGGLRVSEKTKRLVVVKFGTIILAFFTYSTCPKRGRNGRFGILSKKK